jgi:2'-5' RNA ligase
MFFALWPDAHVRAALAALAQRVQAECGGRATPSGKIHLTLFFVGSIERPRIGDLEDMAATVRGEAFELVLDRVGYFRHNRIAWAGAAACPPGLAAIVAQLRERLARIGLRGEERPYVPHITLVRDALRKPSLKSAPAVAWRSRDFVLVESVTDAAASRYDVIARWALE